MTKLTRPMFSVQQAAREAMLHDLAFLQGAASQDKVAAIAFVALVRDKAGTLLVRFRTDTETEIGDVDRLISGLAQLNQHICQAQWRAFDYDDETESSDDPGG